MHTNTYDKEALHKVCNFENFLQRSVFGINDVQSAPPPQPVLLDNDVEYYEKNEIMYLTVLD